MRGEHQRDPDVRVDEFFEVIAHRELPARNDGHFWRENQVVMGLPTLATRTSRARRDKLEKNR